MARLPSNKGRGMNYYSDNAGGIYLSEEDREWLISHGCAIIPRV